VEIPQIKQAIKAASETLNTVTAKGSLLLKLMPQEKSGILISSI
jgi:hypothetical protein